MSLHRKGILFFTVIFLFTSCRQNPLSYFYKWGSNEPDSLYTGKKYRLPELRKYFGPTVAPRADSLTYEGIELGRRLFYDVHLSKSGQRSCASCHNIQYAFSDSGKRFSVNETGLTTRNVPTLQNLAWSNHFFWDGRAPTLADQQKDAFEHELSFKVVDAIPYLQNDTTDVKLFKKAFGRPGTITEEKIYRAVEEFLLSAIMYNSKFDSVIRGLASFTPSEERGYHIIFLTGKGECVICHQSPVATFLLTDDKFHDNGLDLAASNSDFADSGRGKITHSNPDYGTFKTPGLRNIALTAPYMHDGRFKTLKQVIDFYSDSVKLSPNLDPHLLKHINTHAKNGGDKTGGLHLSKTEKEDLLNFLYTLTDTVFIHNPALQNPFPVN